MLFATAGASDYERMKRLDQIKSEIQTLYTVAGHENVIELHDVYEDANYWYLLILWCQLFLGLVLDFGLKVLDFGSL